MCTRCARVMYECYVVYAMRDCHVRVFIRELMCVYYVCTLCTGVMYTCYVCMCVRNPRTYGSDTGPGHSGETSRAPPLWLNPLCARACVYLCVCVSVSVCFRPPAGNMTRRRNASPQGDPFHACLVYVCARLYFVCVFSVCVRFSLPLSRPSISFLFSLTPSPLSARARVCVRVCVRVFAQARVCVCVCVCVIDRPGHTRLPCARPVCECIPMYLMLVAGSSIGDQD